MSAAEKLNFGECDRYQIGKYALFITSSILLGIASSEDDLSAQEIISNTLSIVVIFVLFDVFSSRKNIED